MELGVPLKKFYRNPDNKVLGGVCSGLGLYLGIDTLLVRIVVFAGSFLSVSVIFWVYLLLWIFAPLARTPHQKCQMRGIPPTAENLNRFYYTTD